MVPSPVNRLAVATFTRSFAEVGGLMSYGPDALDSFRRFETLG